MSERPRPSLTVAAIVEREGKFLIVEESIDGQMQLNQPAGHLEGGESVMEACIRETLEETGWEIELQELVNISAYEANPDKSFVRVSFSAKVLRQAYPGPIDKDIHAVHWMSLGELHSQQARHRSPMVMKVLKDYLAGKRFPLAMFDSEG